MDIETQVKFHIQRKGSASKENDIIIEAKLVDPQEIRYCNEIPINIEIKAYLQDGGDRISLLHAQPQMMVNYYEGEMAYIMDTYSADLGEIGICMFEKASWPEGSVVIMNPYDDKGPNLEVFKPDFNLSGLVEGIVAACTVLTPYEHHGPHTYFAFLGNTVAFPWDKQWKTALKKIGCYSFRTQEPATFISAKDFGSFMKMMRASDSLIARDYKFPSKATTI